MACCCPDNCEWEEGAINSFGLYVPIYRKSCPYDTLAKVFDSEDKHSFINWHIDLSAEKWNPQKAGIYKYPPRFRELVDPEIKMQVVDLTGLHDGSVYMVAPALHHTFLLERLPVINFVMNDRGAYCSIEITMLTKEDSYPCEPGYDKLEMRKVLAKNFISRTCIKESSMEIPMRLKPSWNYASLDLQQLVRDAWNVKYLATTRIKINANIRLRSVYFSDRPYAYRELPIELKMNLKQIENVQSNNSPNNFVFKTQRLKSDNEGVNYNNMADFEDEVQQGMSTSVPTNEESLMSLVRPVRKSIVDGNATLTFDYPVSSKTAMIRKSRKQIPALIATGEQLRENLSHSASRVIHKDSRESLDGFCSYVWKDNSESTRKPGVGEWRKIEHVTIQPKVVARTNKSRLKEGIYDLFTGRMMTKADQTFFGFGDKLETSYLSKKKSMRKFEIKRANCLNEMRKNKILETVMSENQSEVKMSHVDPNGDMEFLKNVSQDMDPSVFYDDEVAAPEVDEGQYDLNEEYEGENLLGEELLENLCTCTCPCDCKAKSMWKKSNLTPKQVKQVTKRSLSQRMYQLLRFVPPPSKYLRPEEELRGSGATLLKPFLSKPGMP